MRLSTNASRARIGLAGDLGAAARFTSPIERPQMIEESVGASAGQLLFRPAPQGASSNLARLGHPTTERRDGRLEKGRGSGPDLHAGPQGSRPLLSTPPTGCLSLRSGRSHQTRSRISRARRSHHVSEARGPEGTILYRPAPKRLELGVRTLVASVWPTPHPACQQVKSASSSRSRHGRGDQSCGAARTIRNFPPTEQGGGTSQGKANPQKLGSEAKEVDERRR